MENEFLAEAEAGLSSSEVCLYCTQRGYSESAKAIECDSGIQNSNGKGVATCSL